MQRIAAPMLGGMVTTLSMLVIPAAFYLVRLRESHASRNEESANAVGRP